MTNVKCLLVRQPYASLIAYGSKRYEFRNYQCSIKGNIAIAASRGLPLKTTDIKLNKFSRSFPRGKILSLGTITESHYIDNLELKENYRGLEERIIHGINFSLAKTPLGEPTSDIIRAIDDNNWSCYAWEISNIKPVEHPIDLISKGHGPWITLNEFEEKSIKNSLVK